MKGVLFLLVTVIGLTAIAAGAADSTNVVAARSARSGDSRAAFTSGATRSALGQVAREDDSGRAAE